MPRGPGPYDFLELFVEVAGGGPYESTERPHESYSSRLGLAVGPQDAEGNGVPNKALRRAIRQT